MTPRASAPVSRRQGRATTPARAWRRVAQPSEVRVPSESPAVRFAGLLAAFREGMDARLGDLERDVENWRASHDDIVAAQALRRTLRQGLAAVTLGAGALSFLHRGRILAVLAFAGGFLTPVLLAGVERPDLLLPFLVILDLGAIAVAVRKEWPELSLLAFGFTGPLTGAWVVSDYTLIFALTVLGSATLAAGVRAQTQPPSGERVSGEAPQRPFEVEGMYVEGCSCQPPCPCELTGVEMGCEGVGAMKLTAGKFEGADLAGVSIAYATSPAEWVRIYIDAKDAKQREAAKAFAEAVYAAFGPIEAVKDAKIEIGGKDGAYTVKVDGGKVFSLTTEPIVGGDGKTPLTYSNIHDAVHPTVMQARTLSCSYHDETRRFELSGSNGYFHPKLKSSGKI